MKNRSLLIIFMVLLASNIIALEQEDMKGLHLLTEKIQTGIRVQGSPSLIAAYCEKNYCSNCALFN